VFLVRCLLHLRCIVSKALGILVVEDDELLARMLSDLLREAGYEVWTAYNGMDGYSRYYQHQAATVVTDIDMPGLDGFEMMHYIRFINPSTKAIYISGAPERYQQTLISEGQKFGAVVLRKPFKGQDLLSAILPSECAMTELSSSKFPAGVKEFTFNKSGC
jgi:CheY-like chemotaxis protein